MLIKIVSLLYKILPYLLGAIRALPPEKRAEAVAKIRNYVRAIEAALDSLEAAG